jgi:TonB family protein
MRFSRLVKATAASLLIHVTLATFCLIFFSAKEFSNTQRIEIKLEEAPDTAAKKLNEEKLKRQIVDQDSKPINDEIDEKAKYLSLHNQKVIKETVANNQGKFQNKKSAPSKSSVQSPKNVLLADAAPKLDHSKFLEQRQFKETTFSEGLPVSEKRPTALTNSPTAAQDVSQTQDYLKDKTESVETLLSTREFVYYTFYNRIRNQLNQYWQSKVQEKFLKILHSGRNIASGGDKITKLLITLDQRGNLVKVQILSDSGIKDLDDAAIEAFRAAAPFPNPPHGIEEADGTIKIRWDMIIET